jgi:hypothetical protein
MSITNHKLWLLQNEKAIQCIVKHPERTLHSVAHLYAVDFDELSEFMEKFCPDGVQLTEAGLHGIKIELGIISSSGRQPARPATEERPPLHVVTETGIGSAPKPWLAVGRRPKAFAVERYREQLQDLAEGGERIDNAGPWMAFLRKWFGSSNPPAAQVKLFLAWFDEGADDGADVVKVPKARKAKAAKAPRVAKPAKAEKPKRKYTRRVSQPINENPCATVLESAKLPSRPNYIPPPFSFRLFGYELIIQRRPAPVEGVAS